MNKLDIAKELIILRGKKGWTQKQLADEIKTTQRTVASWESGESIPRNAMRVRIAKAFELPDDYFFDEDSGGISKKQSDRDLQTNDEIIRNLNGLLTEIIPEISEEKKVLLSEAVQEIFKK